MKGRPGGGWGIRQRYRGEKCEVVPRMARIQGSWTFASLNSRLEGNKENEEEEGATGRRMGYGVVSMCLPDLIRGLRVAERIFIELMTSDSIFKASREGSK